MHSTETLWKNQMDIRIGHRFGDFAGQNGGGKTAFGLDNSADVSLGLEYGLTNDLDLGLHRYKGAGTYSQIFEGFAKYKLLRQTAKTPLSIAWISKVNFIAMQVSTNPAAWSSFRKSTDRLSYSNQVLVSRKFGDRLSLQVAGTFVHRNYVAFNDQNSHFALGAGARFKMTKVISLIGEYHYVNFDKTMSIPVAAFDPLGLGVEFYTGGHTFQLNFTNSRGFGEMQYIPSTFSDFTKGQYRMGFTISRVFKT